MNFNRDNILYGMKTFPNYKRSYFNPHPYSSSNDLYNNSNDFNRRYIPSREELLERSNSISQERIKSFKTIEEELKFSIKEKQKLIKKGLDSLNWKKELKDIINLITDKKDITAICCNEEFFKKNFKFFFENYYWGIFFPDKSVSFNKRVLSNNNIIPEEIDLLYEFIVSNKEFFPKINRLLYEKKNLFIFFKLSKKDFKLIKDLLNCELCFLKQKTEKRLKVLKLFEGKVLEQFFSFTKKFEETNNFIKKKSIFFKEKIDLINKKIDKVSNWLKKMSKDIPKLIKNEGWRYEKVCRLKIEDYEKKKNIIPKLQKSEFKLSLLDIKIKEMAKKFEKLGKKKLLEMEKKFEEKIKEKIENTNYNDKFEKVEKKVEIFDKNLKERFVFFKSLIEVKAFEYEKNFCKNFGNKIKNIDNYDDRIKVLENKVVETVYCKICFERKINSISYPCGHAMCVVCLGKIFYESEEKKCPFCKDVIKQILKIFL